jgi:hypothetical protein
LQVIEDTGVQRLEAATLGRRQVVGQGEGGELCERAAEAMELGFQVHGPGRDRRSLRGHLSYRLEGRPQKLAPVGGVSGPEGVEQHLRLASVEPMAVYGAEDGVLLVLAERAQTVGEGGADRPAREVLGGDGGEAAANGLATLDPRALVAQKPGHLPLCHPLVVEQGADDAGLIERRGGAGRGVAGEQQALVLGGGRR